MATSSTTSPAITATSSTTSARSCSAELDADVASFLMDASCLERVSGRLCDDVLRRTRLGAAARTTCDGATSLVIPLDDRREWYRFHHLLAEFLQSELERRDPARRAAIHLRASEWCDAHGDADGAVRSRRARRRPRPWPSRWSLRWFAASRRRPGCTRRTARWLALFTDERARAVARS